MSVNTITTSNKTTSRLNPDGHVTGQSAADKISFYGATPATQPTAGAQAVITYTAGNGTASATSGMQLLTSTYNSTIIANALVTVAAQANAMQAALVTLGLIKGS
jgi:hypothetical protein